MRPFADPAHILITGASSGIGAALAVEYAAPGRRLALAGRDADRLEAVAQRCREAGAACDAEIIDVTQRAAMSAWLTETDSAAALDLVIANAGISLGTARRGEAPDAGDAGVFATNVDGVVNTVEPVLARMLGRRAGQIALMSSLAGFRGFRQAPAYCASKAAVRYYGEGLRRAHRGSGVAINVICPGSVRSPMTDANDHPMPMLMEAERAARVIARGLAADRPRIAFPLLPYLAVRALAAF